MKYKIGDRAIFARQKRSYWKGNYSDKIKIGDSVIIRGYRRKSYNNNDGQPSYYIEGESDVKYYYESDLDPGYFSKIKLYARIN